MSRPLTLCRHLKVINDEVEQCEAEAKTGSKQQPPTALAKAASFPTKSVASLLPRSCASQAAVHNEYVRESSFEDYSAMEYMSAG